MKKSIVLFLVLTSSFAFANIQGGLVKCSIQKDNEKSMIEISGSAMKSIKNGNILGTIQVMDGHLIQVMVEDTESYVMTQEEPREMYKTGAGRAFIQDLKSGRSLIIKCITEALEKA